MPEMPLSKRLLISLTVVAAALLTDKTLAQTIPPGNVATATVVPGTNPPLVGTTPPLVGTTPPQVGTTPPQIVGTPPPGASTFLPAATTVPVTVTTPPPGTSAPVEEWGGCVDPSKPDEPIRIGKKTTICVTLASETSWSKASTTGVDYLRLSFQPQADQYSRFHVPKSYTDLIAEKATNVYAGSNNVTIHVSSQQILSFQRIFYTPNAGEGQVYPHLTAIIDVQKGVVKGITWDDACLFCSDDKCLENTYDYNGNLGTQSEYKQPTRGCYLTQKECISYLTDEEPRCDITVYVVWTGDDADGKALQSSAFRFSAFPEQEIQNRVSDSLPDLHFNLGDFTGGGESGNAAAAGQHGGSS